MISLDRLSSHHREAISAIQRAASGGSVYLVGGVVRDLLLGRAVGDVDIVVSGVLLETLSERLGQVGRTDLVGKRFGVIKFALPDGPTVDVALPRTEHALSGSGHRRDFSVDFDPNLPIERDLERRDFTVNAMAARLEHDGTITLVDAFGGREDLERKRIVKGLKWKMKGKKALEFIVQGSAGLYIKELISGDEGRTKPSVSEILGVPAKVKELDVIKIGKMKMT